MNYLIRHEFDGTLCIDDVGEGLDYERSINLIRLITKKTKKSKNRRFVFERTKFNHFSG